MEQNGLSFGAIRVFNARIAFSQSSDLPQPASSVNATIPGNRIGSTSSISNYDGYQPALAFVSNGN
jgi:hypothetical protein